MSIYIFTVVFTCTHKSRQRGPRTKHRDPCEKLAPKLLRVTDIFMTEITERSKIPSHLKRIW